MSRAWLWVVVPGAGAVGALCRWLLVRGVVAMGCEGRWGTLLVNGVGSLLAGLLCGWLRGASPVLSGALFLGFLGALTTFSTFSLESAQLVMQGAVGRAVMNVALQNGVGVGAALLGVWLSRA